MKNKKTVLLGISGGVDSAVSALLLKKKGYNVIGAFMKNFSDTKNPMTGECNWVQEREMAKKIANHLKIPLITFDFEKKYKSQVINPMYSAYKKGITPNPDISCNTIIKFPLFWKNAKKLKADYIAFGHYARIKKTSSGFQLLKGKDKSKDQSYFLSGISQSDLNHTLFPVGNLTKKEVRTIAKSNHFPNWNKKGTRGICFVGKVDMKSFLEKKIKNHPGKVISPEGKVLGEHRGVYYYTIGQKAGAHIGINIKKPSGFEQKRWYVVRKEIKNNTLFIAPENHPLLKRKEAKIKKIHFISPKTPIPSFLSARIRHLGELHKGRLVRKSNLWHFIFSKPVEGLSPGQFIVMYNKDRLICSGEIC